MAIRGTGYRSREFDQFQRGLVGHIGATDDNKHTIHAVRAGVSYRFDPH